MRQEPENYFEILVAETQRVRFPNPDLVSMDEARRAYDPLFKKFYEKLGAPQTYREKLLVLKAILGSRFASRDQPPNETQAEKEIVEVRCIEFALLNQSGLLSNLP